MSLFNILYNDEKVRGGGSKGEIWGLSENPGSTP